MLRFVLHTMHGHKVGLLEDHSYKYKLSGIFVFVSQSQHRIGEMFGLGMAKKSDSNMFPVPMVLYYLGC